MHVCALDFGTGDVVKSRHDALSPGNFMHNPLDTTLQT